ncbi:MAG TPA: hypothetical protein VJ140_20140 [Actinomycetota bacterium]|nr:hypothetical protein [Actinomycetota bacterium]
MEDRARAAAAAAAPRSSSSPGLAALASSMAWRMLSTSSARNSFWSTMVIGLATSCSPTSLSPTVASSAGRR